MTSLHFKTESGSGYSLTDITFTHEGHTATLERDGIDLVDFATGSNMGQLEPGQTVYFARFPEVGERFSYVSTTHAGCLSTPVTEMVVGD